MPRGAFVTPYDDECLQRIASATQLLAFEAATLVPFRDRFDAAVSRLKLFSFDRELPPDAKLLQKLDSLRKTLDRFANHGTRSLAGRHRDAKRGLSAAVRKLEHILNTKIAVPHFRLVDAVDGVPEQRIITALQGVRLVRGPTPPMPKVRQRMPMEQRPAGYIHEAHILSLFTQIGEYDANLDLGVAAARELHELAELAEEPIRRMMPLMRGPGLAKDYAIHDWTRDLIGIYQEATGRKVGTSYVSGEATGPLIRFLMAATEPLGIAITAHSWRQHVRAFLDETQK